MSDRDPGSPRPPLGPSGIAGGAGAALAVAIPAGIVQRLAGQQSQGLTLLFVLAGFALGGVVASRSNPERYLTQASAASFVAVAIFLLAGVVDRVVSGRSIDAVALSFTAFLAVSAGIVGAELAERRRFRRAPRDDEAPSPEAPR